MVLERIRGIKIDDVEALEEAGQDCYQLALHSARLIIKEVLEDGFFHADPHPGNLVVMPEHFRCDRVPDVRLSTRSVERSSSCPRISASGRC